LESKDKKKELLVGKKRLFNWKVYLQIFFVILIFLFIFKLFYNNIDQLKQYELNFEIWKLITGIFLISLLYFLQSSGWYLITKKFNADIGFAKSFTYWIYSQLGKYIPGKIWIPVSRSYFYEKEGISLKRTTFLFLLETVFSATSACIISLLFLILYKSEVLERYLFLFLVFVVAFCVFLHPKIFFMVINFLLRLLKKNKLEGVSFTYFYVLKVLFIYFLAWGLLGIGFYFIASSVFSIGIEYVPLFIAALSFSFVIGYLAVFAPAGLGVREGMLILVLSSVLPVAVSTAISVLIRVFTTVVELVIVLFTLIFAKKYQVIDKIKFKFGET